MDIQNKTYLSVEKGSKKVIIELDQDMPLGLLFDALMELKGFAVDRMVESQKAEQAEAEKKLNISEDIKEE